MAEINGLTAQEVQARVKKGLTNVAVDADIKTNRQIILQNTFTYFNIIFLILAILVSVVGSFRSLTFLPVIIGNTLIGIFQEIRAKDVLAKMNLLNAAHSLVIRDGKKKKVTSEELVRDDMVIFNAGDQIPADAVVVDGSVTVNESLLTGESDEIKKETGDNLMSGSFIVSGRCVARLVKVGRESYISKLTLEAKAVNNKEQSEMIRSINRIILMVGIIIIPIGILLFYQGYCVNHESLKESVVSMVAAVIGMVPEGLYLLTTVALAVSTVKLASHKVLLHDMKSIETLARVDVLCVDKTGTITENKMVVSEVVPVAGYAKAKGENTQTILHKILGDFTSNMTSDNITMEALKEYFNTEDFRQANQITSFSSQYKYCSVTFEEGAYVLGAPEMVLRGKYDQHKITIENFANKGYRVLVFGKYKGKINGGELTEDFLPFGFILLTNAIRENAKETFEYFAEQGVAIKVISGDNPHTVSEVAKKAGIANADKYVDARTLDSEREIEQAVEKYTVFGRVTPKQKQQFVKALKKQNHTVAMTGDGVNDILAMKDADCSIAMAAGSEAAAQSAQVVLLENEFSRMPEVVLEGRKVVNNVQRSATLFLVKNIFSFFMSIFSVVLMMKYPLEPSQISFISAFTIGIPAFFLALEPNKNIIQGHFLHNVLIKALPAGITDFFAVAALVTCGSVFRLPESDIATAATLILTVVGLMILIKITMPLNKFRIIVLLSNVIALTFFGVVFNKLFAISAMSNICILLVVVFAFSCESFLRAFSKGIEWIDQQICSVIDKIRM